MFLSASIPPFEPSPIAKQAPLLGILPGEGIGPEANTAALKVLHTLTENTPFQFEIRTGGAMGMTTQKSHGTSLPKEIIHFCQEIFDGGGAVLCGPGGGRFVYELRAHFDLYCKFSPLQPLSVLQDVSILRPERVEEVDIIAVRENTSGLYFGEWGHRLGPDGPESAFHHLSYHRHEVDRILQVAFELAQQRAQAGGLGQVCLAVKPHGVPAISQFWTERALALKPDTVKLSILEIDNATYQLIARPQSFDVLVSPNMFGDVLADCGALLLGSRGLSYSGNFGAGHKSVYQTGHGAAYDIAGTNSANPLGQIMTLAMMLRETYRWPEAARAIEQAIENTLRQGYRTPDIASPNSTVLGTQELTKKICQELTAVPVPA